MMARPLKDIIAELEAKYEGSELKNDLMQRRLKIGSYQLHMEYLMNIVFYTNLKTRKI